MTYAYQVFKDGMILNNGSSGKNITNSAHHRKYTFIERAHTQRTYTKIFIVKK